ncbi:hypothetical protein QYE76_019072 [Lolium multiflorum]|uniref:HAT C-terminal dimerisation domain-containing protein n=1 Tax=Lolium multiflorum TaxID=4521 RepID=A0AAD8R3U1_LOLMU|nr:hypothetical protein QYE76_019072 [Lolium multiflorum]
MLSKLDHLVFFNNAEDCEDPDQKLDVLAWWKLNASRFPIVAHLAHDVLAIPISTVASESAFSTGGRILDDFRTSLTPFMLESLVCTQDWLRRTTPINVEENYEELVNLEKELVEEYGNGKGKGKATKKEKEKEKGSQQATTYDGGSQKKKRGPSWPHTGRRGPWLAAPPYAPGAPAPFASFSSRTPSSRKPKHGEDLTKGYSRLAGRRAPREKSSPAGRNPPGKFPPEGEIDAIAIVIKRDIISIIIISTIYTAITTAAPPAGGTFMSITLGATKLLDDMMINYSEWHTERAPQGKKVNSVEETSSLSDKIDVIMSMLVNGRSNVDPNNVPLASLVAQEENVDVNFIKNNNFNNNAYRNNSGNNYRPYPSANGNGYGNSYGNSYNNNRNVPPGLEAMLKEFISTQTAFNKSVEEKLDKIDTIASRVDRLASDVNLLKFKVMPNNDIDNKITTTANAIQVRINENIRLMAERARWDREENEKLAKENNVAKVWTITTTSNANSSHVAPPTINGKIIGVGNVSTPSAKRTKLPEIAKTAETACDKTAEIFSNLGNNDPIAVAHNDLDFDDCHISEVIKFLQKLAKSPNASAINLAFTKHITNALIKAREEKLKLETSIPRKLEDGWEPIIKMKFNDFECNALCDLGASISVMPKKIYDMLDDDPQV